MKQKRHFFILLCISIFLLSGIAYCDTNVSGNQSGTWTLAGSPYYVIGAITIPAGNSLIIEPGVLVEVQGNFRITAEGFITAQGTENDSIKFYRLYPSTWEGIRLEDEVNQSTFSYCRISNTAGTNGYGIHSVNAEVVIQNCFFDNHRKAVHFSAMGDANPSYMEISDSYITTCEQCGILITENSNALVDNCEITACGQGTSYWPAIQLAIQTSTGECNPTIINNHIHHNDKQGITLANLYNYGEVAPHVENNIVEFNLTGIYLYNGQGYYKNNEICNNFIAGDPNSGAGVMLYGSGTNGTFVLNEVAFNFCGFYCINNATSNLGDLGNLNTNDDGENNIHDNIDGTGTTFSVYNGSTLDMKAENNSWDSDNYTEIAETIIDGNDNPSYGIVDFDPIYIGVWNDPHVETQNDLHLFNTPNPFTNSTMISFSLTSQANVLVDIFNLKGQKTKTISTGCFDKGFHSIEWDGKNELGQDVPSGIYFYYLKLNNEIANSGKCLLIK